MINKIYIYVVFFELIKKGVFVYNMCVGYYNILVFKMCDKLKLILRYIYIFKKENY